MEMKKVDFTTRVCAQSNPSVDTKALRRDHTDLREIKQKRKVVRGTHEMMMPHQTVTLPTYRLPSIAPVTAVTGPLQTRVARETRALTAPCSSSLSLPSIH